MDKMGWKYSAKMMRNWFSNPSWVMTERSGNITYRQIQQQYPLRVNETIIPIDWVLNTPRVKPVFSDLYQNWNSERGAERLKKLLTKHGWKPGGNLHLGHINGTEFTSAMDMEDVCDVNSRGIGRYTDVLNDFYGAIFKATLKMAVVGTAHYDPVRKRDVFEVLKIGVYLRDTYDFNSVWHEDPTIGLGVWSKDRMLTKAEMTEYLPLYMIASGIPSTPAWMAAVEMLAIRYPGFIKITNGDFRRFQTKYSTGGDFYVFTDIKWLTPNVQEIGL
jgi:hypothetical protein